MLLEVEQKGHGAKMFCSLRISRPGPQKLNKTTFYGSRGILVATDQEVVVLSSGGRVLRSGCCTSTANEDFDKMLQDFYAEIERPSPSKEYAVLAEQDMLVTKTLDLRTTSSEPLSMQ